MNLQHTAPKAFVKFAVSVFMFYLCLIDGYFSFLDYPSWNRTNVHFKCVLPLNYWALLGRRTNIFLASPVDKISKSDDTRVSKYPITFILSRDYK